MAHTMPTTPALTTRSSARDGPPRGVNRRVLLRVRPAGRTGAARCHLEPGQNVVGQAGSSGRQEQALARVQPTGPDVETLVANPGLKRLVRSPALHRFRSMGRPGRKQQRRVPPRVGSLLRSSMGSSRGRSGFPISGWNAARPRLPGEPPLGRRRQTLGQSQVRTGRKAKLWQLRRERVPRCRGQGRV